MDLNRATRSSGGIVVCASLLMAALVCWPMVRGNLLLLDWVVGGRTPVVPRIAFGLDGGQLAALPLHVVVTVLSRILGTAATWVPFVLFFPLAGWSVSQLVRGSLPAQVGAALLFTVNPFVFDRLAVGQIGVLLGMALLPLWLRYALDRRPARAAVLAVAWTAMIGASIHFVWIVGLLLVIVLVVGGPTGRQLASTGWALLLVGFLNLYLLLGPAGQDAAVAVGHADLEAYRTQPDPHLGLWGNLVGLYGFWRQGPRLAKGIDPLWPVVLVLLLVVIGLGAVAGWKQAERRRLTIILVVSGAWALVLSAGNQGPFGSTYEFVFDHVAPFQVMREPEKFLMLLVMSYAVLFGWGVEALFARAASTRSLVVASVALALPFLYTPTLFNGLSGQVKATHFPSSYDAAARAAGGPGQVLVLPWHLYMAFPYTGEVIANPGVVALGDAIYGDDVELPGLSTTSTSTRSGYIEGLLARGNDNAGFGGSVAPLGVDRVVLFKTVDYGSYDWLKKQSDLHVVFDSPDIEVFENLSAQLGRATAASSTGHVTPKAAASLPPGQAVPVLGDALPGGEAAGTVTRRSTTSFDVTAPKDAIALLPEPYSRTWKADHGKVVQTAWGTMAVQGASHVGLAGSLRLRLVLLGETVAFVALLVWAAWRTRRRSELQDSPVEVAGSTQPDP